MAQNGTAVLQLEDEVCRNIKKVEINCLITFKTWNTTTLYLISYINFITDHPAIQP
jgi:uncharacterized membrane protein YoaT (DUF817 family)